MMSKFIIQVNGPAYGTSASVNALRFTQAVLSGGHQVCVYFFTKMGFIIPRSLAYPHPMNMM